MKAASNNLSGTQKHRWCFLASFSVAPTTRISKSMVPRANSKKVEQANEKSGASHGEENPNSPSRNIKDNLNVFGRGEERKKMGEVRSANHLAMKDGAETSGCANSEQKRRGDETLSRVAGDTSNEIELTRGISNCTTGEVKKTMLAKLDESMMSKAARDAKSGNVNIGTEENRVINRCSAKEFQSCSLLRRHSVVEENFLSSAVKEFQDEQKKNTVPFGIDKVGPYAFSRQAWRSLLLGDWLDDNVIDAYMKYLQATHSRILAFDPSFIHSLCGKDRKIVPGNVANWTKKQPHYLTTTDYILIPLNLGQSHWTLFAVDMKSESFIFYNPLVSYVSSDEWKVGKLREWFILEVDKLRGNSVGDQMKGVAKVSSEDQNSQKHSSSGHLDALQRFPKY